MRRALHYGGARTRPCGRRASARESSGASVYDPSVLTLAGWWTGDFTASPWVGTASAGSSGDNDLTEATNPPAASSGAASFDGTDDELTADGTLATYVDAAAFWGWCLFNADTIGTDLGGGSVINNDTLWATETSAYLGLYLRSSGTLNLHAWDGGDKIATVAGLTASAWHLAHWRHDGSKIYVGLDGTWGTGVTCGSISSLANNLRFGVNYNATGAFDGLVKDAGFAESDLGADMSNIISYVNSTYGLSL